MITKKEQGASMEAPAGAELPGRRGVSGVFLWVELAVWTRGGRVVKAEETLRRRNN